MAEDLLDLGGHVAVVTGAGQNVGRMIAIRMAEHGAALAVNDLYPDRAEAVAGEIEGLGARTIAVPADVGDYEGVQAMAESVNDGLGTPTILVNNAGIPPDMPGSAMNFADTDPKTWDPWVRVNLYGSMHCTHAFLPGMVEASWGRVISIISDAGRTGEPRMAAYGAAKAAIAGFTRGIAKEVGRNGVTANCIALGGIKTPQMAELMTEEMEEKVLKQYQVKRLGRPEDVAAAALFLASSSAEWITGQVLPVNGGYSSAQ